MLEDHARAPHRSAPFVRPALAALALAALATLGGCGVWFGESEVYLPGDRVALREAAEAEAAGRNAAARLPEVSDVRDWRQAGGDASRSIGHAPGAIALERLWRADAGAGSDSESRIVAAPVVGGGRIFTLDAASEVRAFDAATGRDVWASDLTPEDEDGRDGFGGGLALAGDLLVATSGFGRIVALSSADGAERWSADVGAPIRSAPAVAKDLVVAATRDGAIVAVDLATGAPRWRVDGVGAGASILGGGGSAPAISGEVVAAPFPSGDLAILRLSDGRRGWVEPLGAARRSSAISLIADVSSSPVMAGGMIFAGGVSGRLAAFDIPTGRRVWSRDIGGYNRVWAAGPTIFLVSDDARVMALASGNGVTVWETPLPRFEDPEDREGVIAYGGPVLAGGKLFLTSSLGEVIRVDAVTGAIETSIEAVGPTSTPPIVADGRLYVLDDTGDLTAFR